MRMEKAQRAGLQVGDSKKKKGGGGDKCSENNCNMCINLVYQGAGACHMLKT